MAAYCRIMTACWLLWAWWEVMAADHQVHHYARCHLQDDCLESRITSGPYVQLRVRVVLLPLSGQKLQVVGSGVEA